MNETADWVDLVPGQAEAVDVPSLLEELALRAKQASVRQRPQWGGGEAGARVSDGERSPEGRSEPRTPRAEELGQAPGPEEHDFTSLIGLREPAPVDAWDSPFDLRVARPRAIDLRTLWAATGKSEPPEVAAALGAKRPILLTHTLTAFPHDGRAPARVWSLGYEMVIEGTNADTLSVLPAEESLKVADIGQSLSIAIDVGGKLVLPEQKSGIVSTAASLKADTSQKFGFNLAFVVTLRKVVGSGFGAGGAKWSMFRQDEPLDRPHTLLQTVLLDANAPSFRCTVKTHATQAGFMGTRFGARFCAYPDQTFEVSLV